MLILWPIIYSVISRVSFCPSFYSLTLYYLSVYYLSVYVLWLHYIYIKWHYSCILYVSFCTRFLPVCMCFVDISFFPSRLPPPFCRHFPPPISSFRRSFLSCFSSWCPFLLFPSLITHIYRSSCCLSCQGCWLSSWWYCTIALYSLVEFAGYVF